SLAIVLTGGFAVGSILITATEGGIAVGINQYLFGSLTTVSRAQVGLLLIIAVIVLGLVALAYRPLVYMTFDPTAAATARIDVRRYRRLVVMLTALVVVSAMQIMGVILVAGMLVIPVAAAAVTAPSFRRSIGHAVAAGQLAAIGGVTLAYVFGIAAGGAVIIAAIAVYAVVLTADRLGA
ncbi:MAG: iron chelate uptake ABC transporter family permease subunit, partial [Haloquadratum sp.]|nr:iron chelate uptake ABC transporter family permease subunit [Haloquadratum sp.]